MRLTVVLWRQSVNNKTVSHFCKKCTLTPIGYEILTRLWKHRARCSYQEIKLYKIMNQITEWSKGNPSVMMFLMSLLEPINMVAGIAIILKLEQCKLIRGTNLYVLYSDLCNKDMTLVEKLCKSCPNSVLEDACSRQDYSGRELIKQYI